ncbi:hypothetical protein RHGRI_005976 [Rhododendron griersonianum]|uniref:Protein kinase domain-containing protein n=1 Tax=Rhododendron griersonianum TaxID=479676 RepID=A0AAV6LF45_9ERIC|nr:hypothetical protein RHGRI_005976 [Rhododendron griersonianum]
MDEGLGDEAAGVDSVNGKCLLGKDVMTGSRGMATPNEGQYHHGSSPGFAAVLESKNRDIGGVSQHPYDSPHCTEDAGVMVEELTLRNYNGENLAIVGTSKSSEILQTRKNQWQHLYQIGSGVSRGDTLLKNNGQSSSNAWEDVGYTVFSELFHQKPPDDAQNYNVEHSPNNENKAVASSMSPPPGGIRTKILSNSGFSEYFVKNTLKGKGVVLKGPTREGFGAEIKGQTNPKAVSTAKVAFDAPLSSSAKTVVSLASGAGRGVGPSLNAVNGGVNLREWMKARHYEANKVERLYIFRQIVDFVDFSHSQGVALQDLRPSFFKLLPSNQVIYLGSTVHQDTALNLTDQDNLFSENDRNKKRLLEQALHPAVSQMVKKQKFGENLNLNKQWSQFSSRSGFKAAIATDTGLGVVLPQDSWDDLNVQHNLKREHKSEGNSSSPHEYNELQLRSTCTSDPLEEKWYTSPEELNGRGCTFSSNIYVLGVLLFELLGLFDSERARTAAMSDLHHRILPPNFLSENPREAGFCLWLLHPELSSRPSAREVLQSGVISGIVESYGDELSSSLSEDDTESELLLHFLLTLKEEKQKDALKLVEEIKCLETDIEEVERRQPKQPLVLSGSPSKPLHSWGNRFQYGEHSSFELHSKLTSGANTEMRLMKNISQLESAYFSTRSSIQLSESAAATRTNKELLEDRDGEYSAPKDEKRKKPMDRLGAFFGGLCKYARYSKFEVRGVLRNGDLHNSANVICSLSFDRDQEYFAAAGVSKRIKIYDFQALFDKAVDIHYPAIEMSNKSRLSCICWNSYIRNYLASTDYDGIVKRNSLCTIRNIANICCVQFSPHSSHLLAFGSADYKTYCYDLRNVSNPWCILDEHDKAVSFVKFLDSETLVSASTDNTLKLWDLNKTSSTDLSATSILTLKGHTNEKNFVGLSVADGYIACGSETNEVYAYYRSLPMPVTSYKFGSIDPISGKETDDNNGLFVSSVCWKKNSDMLVAANSTGCIKVLQMV